MTGTRRRNILARLVLDLPGLVVQFHICLVLVASSAQSYRQFTEDSQPDNGDVTLQKMALDPTTNKLYAGSVNRLYKLNSDLGKEYEISTGPVEDHPTCFPPPGMCSEPDNYQRIPMDNVVKILLVNKDHLITCGSVYQGICQVRSLENFEILGNNTAEEIAANTRIGTSVGFIAKGPLSDESVLYTATSNADWVDNYVPTVSMRKLSMATSTSSQRLFAVLRVGFRAVSQIIIPESTLSDSPCGFNITYVYGFASGNFSYFLAVQPDDHRSLPREVQYYSKIIRICQADINFFSYIELPLECWKDGVNYNVAQSAFIAKADKAGGERWQNEDTLFVTFAQSQDHLRAPRRKSAVCMYLLSDLDQKFFDRRLECVQGGSRNTQIEWYKSVMCSSTPTLADSMTVAGRNYCHMLDFIGPMGGTDSPIQAQALYTDNNTLFKAIVVSHKPRDSAVVVGDDRGHVRKFMITSETESSLSKDLGIVEQSSVVENGLLLSLDEEYVYVMTQRKIYKIPLKICEHYKHCSTCVTSNDPNQCGWCGSLCTTEKECLSEWASGSMPDGVVNSEDGPDWVTDACVPVIYEVSPLFGPLEGNTTVYIIGDSLNTDGIMVNATLDVTIAYQPCGVIANASNATHIVCVTQPVQEQVEGPVVVSIEVDDSNLSFAIGGTATSEPRYIFSYVEPEFTRFSPVEGPMFGGTSLTLHGISLRAGNTQAVMVAGVPCHVHRVRATKVHCITVNVSELIRGPVILSLDNLQLSTAGEFQYRENPFITSISPERSYLSGETNVAIYGFNLHLAQSLQLEVSVITGSGHRVVETRDCLLPWSETDNEVPNKRVDVLECPAPDMRGYGLNPSPNDSVVTNLTVIINNHARLTPMSYDGQIALPQLRLLYYPDPVLKEFDGHLFKLDPESNYVTIYGENLDLVSSKEEISVTVGNQSCIVEELHSSYLTCKVPSELMEQGSGSGIYVVEVKMGGNHKYDIGLLQVSPPDKKQAASIVGTAIGIAIGIVALVGVVLVVVVLGIRRHRHSKRMRSVPINYDTVVFNPMEPEESAEVHVGRIKTYLTNPGSVAYGGLPTMQRPLLEQINNELAAEISQVLIHEESLAFGKLLGQGHFGCVYAGKMTQDGEDRRVAIKSLHQGSLPEITSFLREGIMMKDFHHDNVLTLIGVSINSETNMPYVVLPFMQNGDLLSFVREPTNELTSRQLLECCRQIATGMQYLSSLKFVHRDLAARNCMLDDMTVKVADFGLSRDIYERDYYSAKDRTAKLPIRWMAMECLERNFYNTMTDVWSFGVVMWELLTRGVVPYPSCDNIDILKHLHGGRRLPQPDHCPDHVYKVMLNCWSVNPIDRPTFCLLVDKLNGILSEQPEDLSEPETNAVYVNVPGASAFKSY